MTYHSEPSYVLQDETDEDEVKGEEDKLDDEEEDLDSLDDDLEEGEGLEDEE